MVFPYYPGPEDDEQEPTEEHQPEASQPAIPSYLYDVFAYMGEDLTSLYPPKPTSDEGYVTPGKPHTIPSGPTTHPDPPKPTGGQSTRQGADLDSGGQGSTSSSRAEDPPDNIEANDATDALAVLPDIRDAQQSAIASADIKFFLAAPNNAVLNELRIMCQQENIPPALRDRPALLLRLCADYGIDEENDAEARKYLDYATSAFELTDTPTTIWQSTLTPLPTLDQTEIAHLLRTPEPRLTPTATGQSTLTPLPTLDQTEIAHLLRTPEPRLTPTTTWQPTPKPRPTLDQTEIAHLLRAPEPSATPIGYLLQSFVVNDKTEGGTVDIELSDFEHANRSRLGLLSRDVNMLGSTASFQIQSPVVGPDVRVEILSRVDEHDRNLGNYVVISFPASVFLQNPQVMDNLANDPNHKPSEWREDGRIFIGFAHLLSIEPENIYPEAVLQDAGKAGIGWTGNTAFHLDLVNHLDVSMAYFGRTKWNRHGFAEAMDHMSKDRSEPNSYMAMVIRSNLNQGEGQGSVYGEAIDMVWIWPHYDELENARTTRDAEGNNESIYPKE